MFRSGFAAARLAAAPDSDGKRREQPTATTAALSGMRDGGKRESGNATRASLGARY